MDLDILYHKIIPPSDYQHRNGFNNQPLLDKLKPAEKSYIENRLIDNLSIHQEDTLIVETLGYLRSKKALPKLYRMLGFSLNSSAKIIIATSIYEICKDEDMIEVAIQEFKKVEEGKDAHKIYGLIVLFYYLAKLKGHEIYDLIAKYRFSSDHLLAYNSNEALRSMGQRKDESQNR